MSTLLERAVADPLVQARYQDKLRTVPGTDCIFFLGAISGRGHCRFYLGTDDSRKDVTIIAHRYGYALAHGVEALRRTSVLGHRCDNPLCQFVHSDHVWESSATENRNAYLARRHHAGNPLTDLRGSRERAIAIRSYLLAHPAATAEDLRTHLAPGIQLRLW